MCNYVYSDSTNLSEEILDSCTTTTFRRFSLGNLIIEDEIRKVAAATAAVGWGN